MTTKTDFSEILNTHIDKKFPNFITEQSNDISYDFICAAQQNISRSESIFKLNEHVRDMKISSEIEIGIFEYCLVYVKIHNFQEKLVASVYDYTVYNIIKNIMMNKELVVDMKNGMIKPRMIAFMSPSQLNPKKWATLLAKKQLKEEQENNMTTTDIYKCRKCDKKKCTIKMMQTRALDEPMTIFVRCCNCYNTWTM